MALADDFGVAPHHPGETVRAVLKMDRTEPRLGEGVIDAGSAPTVPWGVNGR
ncbi:hypothetical protein ABTX34_30600 [Streptomyces sp. NPDC096538]|uniref:hypothetical protein n=1 Tax=Streptomyces sp. NPDC096538 TaxID=3155427 RepID=UPI003320D401